MTDTTPPAPTNEAVVERTFRAPLERVWRAWTDPEQASNWYGPAGAVCPVCEIDAREGGSYRLCMRMPDGDECWEEGVYREIVEHRRIVTDASVTFQGRRVEGLSTRVTFEAVPGGTRVVVRQTYRTDDFSRGAAEGWTQCLERLAAALCLTGDGLGLVIEREFDAPVARVWRAWTDPDATGVWFCPRECAVVASTGDCRVGGAYRTTMRCGEREHTVRGVYREVVEQRRLVFTHVWDREGAPETVVAVTFEPLDGDRTSLRLEQTGFEAVENARDHASGWTSCLEHLAEHLGVG